MRESQEGIGGGGWGDGEGNVKVISESAEMRYLWCSFKHFFITVNNSILSAILLANGKMSICLATSCISF